MMKRFFSAFLGSMAAIWASVFLGSIFLLITIVIIGMSMSNKKEILAHSILKIELAGDVVDRSQDTDLIDKLTNGNEKEVDLEKLVAAVKNAKSDKDIDGIALDCRNVSAGLAQSEAIRDVLKDFKSSGKWIYSYADNYSQIDYFIASVSDEIYVNPVGMVDIHGLTATNIYFKDLLDKLGVNVQVVKVGTFKSAVEPFTQNESSEANREQQEHYLNSFWTVISNDLAKQRKVTVSDVNEWADTYSFADSLGGYLDKKIVDGAFYRHQFDEFLSKKTGLQSGEKPRYVTVEDYYKSRGLNEIKSSGKQIAVLYALGDITESSSGGIASDRLVPQILNLAENKEIDGLILRINSGGGSAYASEQIWEALEQYKAKSRKPFYVSMSDVAASGGYYIACGADKIYADSLTITGSIGIFGLIPDLQELLNDKLGVHTSTVSTNEGSFPGIFKAMPPAQKDAMQAYINRGYELFVSRVANGRKMPVDSIKKIAEGRVWDGITAQKIGLVDELGGLGRAISDMSKQIGAPTNYYTVSYPVVEEKWWEEFIDLNLNSEEMTIKNNIGKFAKFYKAAVQLTELDPMQCRIDYIIIE